MPRGRILVVEPTPTFGGGSEVVVHGIARGLRARGWSVHLVHRDDGGMLGSYQSFVSGVHRDDLPLFMRRSPWRTIAGVIRLKALCKRLAIEAVLSSHLGYLRSFAILRVLGGPPSLVHLGLPPLGSGRAWRATFSRLEGVAPSSATRLQWREAGWSDAHLHQIPNAVDIERFKPVSSSRRATLRGQWGLDSQAPVVACVGRLSREKGTTTLLHAWSIVHRQVPQARLLLVGPVAAGFEPELEQAFSSMEPAASATITVRPATPFPEEVVALCDVSCSPSHAETFGLAALEAAAAGARVVATDVGSAPEILRDCASFVGVDDRTALAAALVAAMMTQASPDAGGCARERVLAACSLPRTLDAYESLLDQLVTTRR